MPLYYDVDDNGKRKLYYKTPLAYLPDDLKSINKLIEIRRAACKNQEIFQTLQKEFPREKLFKDQKNYHLRIQRAVNLILPWLNGVGNLTRVKFWPTELASELDYVMNAIY